MSVANVIANINRVLFLHSTYAKLQETRYIKDAERTSQPIFVSIGHETDRVSFYVTQECAVKTCQVGLLSHMSVIEYTKKQAAHQPYD